MAAPAPRGSASGAPAGPRASVAPAAAAPRGSVAAAGSSAPRPSALGLSPEVWFDPAKEEALAAKEAADKLEIRALPVRQYLEASVVPLLLHGLQLLAIERPENPVDYLAKYLIAQNPMKGGPGGKKE